MELATVLFIMWLVYIAESETTEKRHKDDMARLRYSLTPKVNYSREEASFYDQYRMSYGERHPADKR